MRRDRLRGHGRTGQWHDNEQRPFFPFGWGMPTTAASATPVHPMARFSTSIELIHSPPDLMTSLGAIGEANDIVLVKDGNVAAVEPAILKQGFFFTCLNDKRLLGHRHSSHRTELGSGR
jgi:hypothetical protein